MCYTKEVLYKKQYCGHAHGGQFCFPMIGDVVAPNQQLFSQYISAVYEEGNTKMAVGRGLGESIILVCINNRTELVVVK